MTPSEELVARLTRPIVGIENRTAQEVFDIMVDRFRDPPAPIERLPDVERIRTEACSLCGKSEALIERAEGSRCYIVCNDRSGPQDTSPRPDLRQEGVDPDVRRRLLSVCDTLETARGQAFPLDFHGLAADIRAAIASMDPVRQIAMQLRKAAETGLDYAIEAANERGKKDEVFDNIMGDIRRMEAALASADAVLGEGE